MTRFNQALCLTPLLLAAGVQCDQGLRQSVRQPFRSTQNMIENAGDALLNEAANATEVAANKIENAGPELENSAATIKERAGRVADKAEALGNRIEAKIDGDKPAENTAARQPLGLCAGRPPLLGAAIR